VIAQSLAWDVDDATANPLQAAVAVWAVFEALDTVPADADEQRAYLNARALAESHLARLGLPAERLRAAVEDVRLPAAEHRGRGDPRLGA
jgi:hypothetical protein